MYILNIIAILNYYYQLNSCDLLLFLPAVTINGTTFQMKERCERQLNGTCTMTFLSIYFLDYRSRVTTQMTEDHSFKRTKDIKIFVCTVSQYTCPSERTPIQNYNTKQKQISNNDQVRNIYL